MQLHINIEDLLSASSVESNRIEFKKGWNPDAIYRSICAFANDFDNSGGGYILVGVDEEKGVAKRPVEGLSPGQIAAIQQKMIGFNHLINPTYDSKLYIQKVDKKDIIVLWIPGGSNRPYQVPEQITATHKHYFYYIRKYANSVKAGKAEEQELIALANQIPFDDRVNTGVSVDEVSMVLVRDHLRRINSKLAAEVGKKPDEEILEQIELLSGPAEHQFPRNVALMMFSENPEKYFPCTRVEVVHFPEGPDSPVFVEFPHITGPVPSVIERTLDLLKTNFLKEKVTKIPNASPSDRAWNYPFSALKEAVANALYHRDYLVREPVEIRIYPDSIVILNYGGPDRSIKMSAFNTGHIRPRRYRNRRLGDFLKELHLTEGKATGIPAILKALRENGSPAPNFDTDDDRTFFEIEIFRHPAILYNPASDKGTGDVHDKLIAWLRGKFATPRVAVAANAHKGTVELSDDLGDKLSEKLSDKLGDKLSEELGDDLSDDVFNKWVLLIMALSKENLKRIECLAVMSLSNETRNVQKFITPLEAKGIIVKTFPSVPRSPKQKYSLTPETKKQLTTLIK